MDFDFSDEQKLFGSEVRRLLVDGATPAKLRKLIDAKAQWDSGLWQRLAEMGVLGAAIPEEHGGVGLSEYELCVASEELGRVTAPVPFLSSIAVAAEAIRLAGSPAQKERWLAKLASGEAVATFAFDERPGAFEPAKVETTLEGGKLTGTKMPVPDAGLAAVAIVAARDKSGPVLALVELDAAGVTREPLEGFDELRHHGRLTFAGAPAEALPEATGSFVERLLARAAVYEAFEQLGGAEACLYMARDYAAERKIFGRSLSSYQATKHKLADILMEVEIARSNAWYAVWTIVNDAPDFMAAAATARLSAINAYELASRENLQVHGGIGYTFEADCHFHYRRSRLLTNNLGGREIWGQRLVEALRNSNTALGQ